MKNAAARLDTIVRTEVFFNKAKYVVVLAPTSVFPEVYKDDNGLEMFCGYLSSAPDGLFEVLDAAYGNALQDANAAFFANKAALASLGQTLGVTR